ncbi:TPA: PepSY domain-containing protein [Neisseria subflava]|uniref:PepSY domain-containing protein n=1 Tax=unclassified Neisseria TaxID=2623750 RepID=UPI0028D47357|nr:PepSY domain-containing protein [uncultured Neisseria sp.]
MKKFLLTAIVVLSAATAGASDYIEHKIYNDKNFEQNRAKAVKILEQRGYQVHDVEADSRRGQPVLDIEAFKDGREYDIVLSYPDLKIIKERIDY